MPLQGSATLQQNFSRVIYAHILITYSLFNLSNVAFIPTTHLNSSYQGHQEHFAKSSSLTAMG